MPNNAAQRRFVEIDITPWTGETPDEMLALGAGEYSVQQAKDIVQLFAEVSTSCDVDAFIQGFTEDSVTSFNDRHDIVGRAALREFMAPRFAAFARPGADFLCRKRLRSLSGNIFGVIWVNHWRNPTTGELRQAKGVEFWAMRSGLIARWDASIVDWKLPA
ncbi:MAG: nuclear transport factor 2 family protein [Alphaproteobacteria bacterium]|nr:nuclear transport factor 2 family protein [Alphaproteobacteria bacterium]